ncbi:MAG: indolepyruvate ferredoxin oxidoreductase family protein, partial [Henriciella sp.]|nr:indolepyruvate ferredoxin oxidoreductase family protein [Henriciella sp.]
IAVSLEKLGPELALALADPHHTGSMAAFDVGRIAAYEPSRLEPAKDPRGHITPMSLDELIENRAQRLTAYQGQKYADQYRDVVATVRAAETKAGLGERLTEAVARYAFKLMAYKDEYEVARLWTDGAFDAYLAKKFKGGKINYHLAPPIFSKKDEDGHLKKKAFGQWMKTGFKVLKRFKWLRGTRFDPFGWTEERKMERKLRDQYLDNMQRMLTELSAKNIDLAVEIAEIPDDIRGYGHVKEEAVSKAAAREAELWQHWPDGTLPRAKTTLIAAE